MVAIQQVLFTQGYHLARVDKLGTFQGTLVEQNCERYVAAKGKMGKLWENSYRRAKAPTTAASDVGITLPLPNPARAENRTMRSCSWWLMERIITQWLTITLS